MHELVLPLGLLVDLLGHEVGEPGLVRLALVLLHGASHDLDVAAALVEHPHVVGLDDGDLVVAQLHDGVGAPGQRA